MASPYSTPQRGAVVVSPYADEEPMPAGATGTLFLLASGFGIGALVILFAFVFLIGIGDLGHNTTSGPTAAAAVRRDRTRRARTRAQSCAEHGRPHRSGNDRSGACAGQSEYAESADPGTAEVTLQPHPEERRRLATRNAFRMRGSSPGIRPVGPRMTLLNPDGISRADGARRRCAAPCR